MPQMSPLMWFNLFIIFIMIFMIFNMLNYFNFFISNELKNYLNKNNQSNNNYLTWKW